MTGLEVPVFSPVSARAALSRGAGRLEINAGGSYPQGGTTPDQASEVAPLSDSPVPLRIMIRPRGPPADGGPDFIYSDPEFDEMRDSIRGLKEGGSLREERGDGFVFGVLKTQGQRGGGGEGGEGLVVDVDRNRALVQLARPFACVFHRAFDDVLGSSGSDGPAIEDALRAVADCGFDGILTSGGPGSAPDNVEALSRVVAGAGRTAAGLEVVVGGGVRSANAQVLRDALCPRAFEGSRVWFHSSCLTARSGDHVDEEEVERIAAGLDKESLL